MIAIGLLASSMRDLTSEAVRVAVWLAANVTTSIRLDSGARVALGRQICLTPSVIEKAVAELAHAGLINRSSRVEISAIDGAMSDPPPSLAFCSTPTLPGQGNEPTTHKGVEGPPDDDREAGREQPTTQTRQTRTDATRVADVLPHLGARGRAREAGTVEAVVFATDQPLNADTRVCVDAFDQRYREANDGAKPTWGARQFTTMRDLVRKHGLLEVQKRIEIMYTAPPRWPPPPYDLNTLSMHFDKFAKPAATGGMIDRFKGGPDYYGATSEVPE